ncbi:MAG: hypothetical protein JJ892_04050 [Balneola sp.]|nr:hypothetical protein [Balneola sp.]MBO6651845.1 hypothetical protein [Balneola sp.]MBO6710743.1 hypothetical protein [Balneola sp.]MBO6799430.1 hypothetical protein [Balneola sp.]MBO6869442.1 hypothetical protein [Balneola sp.]
MQSPTDGEIAIHHFAESGVMELVEIILSKGMPMAKGRRSWKLLLKSSEL